MSLPTMFTSLAHCTCYLRALVAELLPLRPTRGWLGCFAGLAIALGAVGCGSAGSDLADAARNISRRHPSTLGSAGAGPEDDYSAATDPDETADAPPADHPGSAAPSPTDEEGRKLKTEPVMAAGPASDDSVRCGNGVLDEDELCDVAIEEGEEGACPTDCEPLDACHAAKLEVRTCWSQCVLGDPVPCE